MGIFRPLKVLRFFQSGQDAFWRERRFAQAHAGSIEDGIRDSCGDWRARWFTATESRHFGAIDQDDVDLWNVREPDHGIRPPIERSDSRGVEFHLFQKGAA